MDAAKFFGLALHGFMIVLAVILTRFIWSYPYGDNLVPISHAEEEATRWGVTAIIWFLCIFLPLALWWGDGFDFSPPVKRLEPTEKAKEDPPDDDVPDEKDDGGEGGEAVVSISTKKQADAAAYAYRNELPRRSERVVDR